jgi:nitronate monooxygenase
MPTVKESFPWT